MHHDEDMHEHHGERMGGETREQDRFLPVANIARIMKTVLPPNAKIGKDAKETIQECVSEFISFITSEASDKCVQEKRKTINGDDILWAMSTLGFDPYIAPLEQYLGKYRDVAKADKPEKKPTPGKVGGSGGVGGGDMMSENSYHPAPMPTLPSSSSSVLPHHMSHHHPHLGSSLVSSSSVVGSHGSSLSSHMTSHGQVLSSLSSSSSHNNTGASGANTSLSGLPGLGGMAMQQQQQTHQLHHSAHILQPLSQQQGQLGSQVSQQQAPSYLVSGELPSGLSLTGSNSGLTGASGSSSGGPSLLSAANIPRKRDSSAIYYTPAPGMLGTDNIFIWTPLLCVLLSFLLLE